MNHVPVHLVFLPALIAPVQASEAPDLSFQGQYLESFFRQLDAVQSGARRGQSVRIVEFGDSHLAAGAKTLPFGRQLGTSLGPWAAGRIETVPLAKVGASIRDLEIWLRHPGFRRYLGTLHPGLVILRFGTNDAAILARGMPVAGYESWMRNVIREARSVFGPGVSFIWMAPPDQGKYGKWMPALIEAMRRVCATEALFWLDQWALMGGSGSFERWQAGGKAARDGLHYTAKGYAQLQAASANVLAFYYHQRR